MLDHPTLDQLKTLRLDGMAEAFAEMQKQDGTAGLSHAEWLGLLIHSPAVDCIAINEYPYWSSPCFSPFPTVT